MAIKAKKLGSKKGFEKSLKGGGNRYALRVPPEGAIVRFLTEPEEWFEVPMHFDEGRQTSYPCSDDCIGCDEGLEARSRWFAVVYSVDEDRVTPFDMPKSVVKMLYKKYDRYNTITDRNYEITKEGTGLNTEYDVDAMSAEHLRGQSKMEIPDLFDFVTNMYEDAMRQISEGEEVSAAGRQRTRKSTPRRRVELDEDDFEDDDLDDEEDTAPRRRPTKVKAPVRKTTKSAPTKRRTTRR